MWIKIDTSIRDHRKVWKAADETAQPVPLIIGCMVSLWTWCVQNAPEGDLTDISAATIARAAQWPDDAQEFEKTLILCGFLDVDAETGTRSIHNWMDDDRTGGSLAQANEKKEKDRERKRRQRAEKSRNDDTAVDAIGDESADMQSRGCHADVTRTSRGIPRVDKIREDKIRQEKENINGQNDRSALRADARECVRVSADADKCAENVADADAQTAASDARADMSADLGTLRADAQTAASAEPSAEPSATGTRRKRTPKEEPDAEADAAFMAFWREYPRKVARREAYRAWRKIKHTDEIDAQIMDGVKRYAQEQKGTEPRFIRHAERWLNGESWKDEPETSADGARSQVYSFADIEAAVNAADAETPTASTLNTRRTDVKNWSDGFGDGYKNSDLWQMLNSSDDADSAAAAQ